ncbi:heparin lyase I family protein [Oxalobacteraceae bacterium]|nr:heparin lyase I family protein [Oxalobacteraceae bacterium]
MHKTISLSLMLAFAGNVSAAVQLGYGGVVNTMDASTLPPLQYTSQYVKRNEDTPLTGVPRYFSEFYQKNIRPGDTLELVRDPAGANRDVFHMTLTSDGSDSQRNEIVASREYIKTGERWYAFSVYFPADWKPVKDYPTIVWQLHTSQDFLVTSPPMALLANEMRLELGTTNNHLPVPKKAGDVGAAGFATKASSASQHMVLGALELKKWYCFVVKADWQYQAGNGAVQVWMNGELKYEAERLHNSYETWLGNYTKTGMYQPGQMGIAYRHIYTDFIHIGSAGTGHEAMYKQTPCYKEPAGQAGAQAQVQVEG